MDIQLRHENIDIPTSSRFSVTVPISTSSRKCQSAAGSALSCAAVNLCLLLNQINFINENLLGASWIVIYEKRKMLSNAYLLFSIYLQKFVLIQPRTSPPNICKILQKKNYQNLIANLIVILLIRTSKPISPDSSTSPQVPAHDRPPQQLLRPGARARRGGGPGRGRAGAAKDTNE